MKTQNYGSAKPPYVIERFIVMLCCVLLCVATIQAQSTPDQKPETNPIAQDLLIVIQQDGVRFTALKAVQELRLQVLDQTGQIVYDSGPLTQPELTWPLSSSPQAAGAAVKSGLYAYKLSIKEQGAESVRVRAGHFIVDRAQDRDGQADRLWVTSQSGSGVGAELTVARSGDETISGTSTASDRKSASAGNGASRTDESGSKDATTGPITAATLGTVGRIAKFTSTVDLGNSVITELNGNIGIGTTTPSSKLQVLNGDISVSGGGISTSQGSINVSSFSGANAIFAQGGSGIIGIAFDNGQAGVIGNATAATGTGVRGLTSGGNGVEGLTQDHNHAGIRGENGGGGHGVEGISNGTLTAVSGGNTSTGNGVIGNSTGGTGVSGFGFNGTTGFSSSSGGAGIVGTNTVAGGFAGLFTGNVRITGSLSKASGSFQIDHPLDPENKYLFHSFVESPDMMNVYNGNVTTDGNGEATITLPDYFQALNRDFRYQLTVVGQFARAMVASKIAKNQFTIKTDQPNVEVSWQVTGVRQDAYAKAHPIQVEVEKSPKERGSLLHPEAFGRAPKNLEEEEMSDEAKELIKKRRAQLMNSNQ